jgi:hypothetical protein
MALTRPVAQAPNRSSPVAQNPATPTSPHNP